MMEKLLSAWVFFAGILLAVICYAAGYIHGSRLFTATKNLNIILKRLRTNMDRLHKKMEEN